MNRPDLDEIAGNYRGYDGIDGPDGVIAYARELEQRITGAELDRGVLTGLYSERIKELEQTIKTWRLNYEKLAQHSALKSIGRTDRIKELENALRPFADMHRHGDGGFFHRDAYKALNPE